MHFQHICQVCFMLFIEEVILKITLTVFIYQSMNWSYGKEEEYMI